jgi:hypothetical protein
MKTMDDHSPLLPGLEQLLVRAARREAVPSRARRRWLFVALPVALLLAAGAAAATGVLHIADGQTSRGSFSVERRPAPESVAGEPARGSVCLQLRYDGGPPSYGCGEPPTAAQPFGLLVADSLDERSAERVIYGLVSSDIASVSVLGGDGRHTDATTGVKSGLPGRFFAIVVPDRGRIEVVGYDDTGKEIARIGSRAEPRHAPRSLAEARALGDPAGFAPAVAAPLTYLYRGQTISESEAVRRGLACLQEPTVFRCFDSTAEAEVGRP